MFWIMNVWIMQLIELLSESRHLTKLALGWVGHEIFPGERSLFMGEGVSVEIWKSVALKFQPPWKFCPPFPLPIPHP